jgi:FKBP-type peptidyl-prolyl cis-trans isomerase FklB
MKKIFIICIGMIAVAHAQVKKPVMKPAPKSTPPVFKNSTDSFSYAIGLEAASFYKLQGVPAVNSALVKRAIDDVYGKKTLLLTQDQSTMTIQNKMNEYMRAKNAPQRQFLVENKKRPGVVELPSGLQYEIIKQGNGPVPKATDVVKAHYALSLINGQEIESSYKAGQPIEIGVNRVIQGWVQALQLMPVGSKWKLFIPSDLGYGNNGGGAIPGGATLIFDIELLEIVKK